MPENTSLKPFLQTWAAWLGMIGVVLGLVLVGVATVTGWMESLPAGQNAVISGLVIAVGSAVSAVSYRYLRTIVMQVAGGITVLAGLWAIIGPFILSYPLDSVLLVVSVLVGVLIASLAGFALISAPPIDDAAKPLNDIFGQTWRGWAGMPGLVAGVLLLTLAFLANGEASSVVRVNTGVVGAALAILSALCAFGYGRQREAVVQLAGWLTVLVGFWAVISAFVLGTVGSSHFLVTVFTGLLAVLTASYALLTTPAADGTRSFFDFDISTTRLELPAAFWTWRVWLGVLGCSAGIALILVAAMTGWVESLPAGQVAVLTGLVISVGSIVSSIAYGYERTLVGQIAGGVTAFVGIWTVVSPFILSYPQDSALFLTSILLGVLTAALSGYAITLGDNLRLQQQPST